MLINAGRTTGWFGGLVEQDSQEQFGPKISFVQTSNISTLTLFIIDEANNRKEGSNLLKAAHDTSNNVGKLRARDALQKKV